MKYLPVLCLALSALFVEGATADDKKPAAKDCPPAVATGSSNVTIDGKMAARAGDLTGCGDAVVEGSPNVFINGRPAAVVGDKTGCGGAIVTGSTGVFINGKPVAAAGSLTSDCPPK